jgi:hypothetical protein
MKHAEVLAIPVGTKIVVSERVDRLERASHTNSVIGVLESHDNFPNPYWSGLYWRPETEVYTPTDPKARTKNYHVTTELSNSDGTTTKVRTLLSGKYILGIYDASTQQMWDDLEKAQKERETEEARLVEVMREAEARGAVEATNRKVSVRDLVESVLERKFGDDDRELSVSISCRNTVFTNEEKTHANPVLSGTVQLDYKLFEELIEKMYAQLDAR